MWTTAPALAVSAEQRQVLEKWIRAHNAPRSVVMRSQIILHAADGQANHAIAERLGITRTTVLLWRERFREGGLEGLRKIAPGRGRKPVISAAKVDEIVHATLHAKPPGATQWSCRSMAQAMGVSPDTVNRIWRAHQLQPHRVETFKLSNDPRFSEKLVDVVGLYLNPPEHAVVLCVDEKSQIQALQRTQPGLPMKKGRCGTMTHDYKRHGTASLFAALELLEGKVIGQVHRRHRHQEFLTFLRQLDHQFPADLDLHLILDNYGTHSHPTVQAWLTKHRRFQLHFIPTSSSWLNLVERWFAELTEKAIRRGSFCSLADLVAAIDDFMDAYNQSSKPFVWTATAQQISEKIARCRAITRTEH